MTDSSGGLVPNHLSDGKRSYLINRLMRRDKLAGIVRTIEASMADGLLPQAVQDLLVEVQQVINWHSQDRAELLLLASRLASSKGINVCKHPLEGRRDSYVVSFSLPTGLVGWNVSSGQAGCVACPEGPKLGMTTSLPEHLADRHERISAFRP